jgi:y4mF family transcriptional regulator
MLVSSMHDMAAAVRGRRLDLGLSQAEVARRVGVSRVWVNSFEAGKSTVAFALVLRLLEVLGLRLDLAPAENNDDSSSSSSIDLDAFLQEYDDR